MTVTMPEELAYGYVTGQYILAVGDGPDADTLPDARPALGLTVTLTPITNSHPFGSTEVLRQPLVLEVGPDGWVRETDMADGIGNDEGAGAPPGAWVIAGRYQVTFGGAMRSHYRPRPFTATVTAAHTENNPLYLPAATGATPAPGVTLTTLVVQGSPVPGYLIGVDPLGELVYVPGGEGGGISHYTTISGLPGYPTAFPPAAHDHDSRYIRTVNGTAPDASGNVAVAGGGGGVSITENNNGTADIESSGVSIIINGNGTANIGG